MPMSTTICKNDTFSCFFSTIHIFLSYDVSRAWSQSTIYLPIIIHQLLILCGFVSFFYSFVVFLLMQ